MNQKVAAVVVVAVVVIIAVVGAGAFLILRGGGVSVTSFDMKGDITSQGLTTSYRIRVKDLGSQNLKVRVDTLSGQYTGVSFIMRIGESKVYVYENGQWVDTSASAEWQYYVQQYPSAMQKAADYLSRWTGGDVTYQYQGSAYRLYEIQVNPTLDDSVFTPS